MAKSRKKEAILEGGPRFTGGASIPLNPGPKQTTSELKVPQFKFSSSRSKDAIKNLKETAKKQKKTAAQKRNRKKKPEPENKTASNNATQKRKQRRTKKPAPENPRSAATNTAAKRQVQQLQSGNGVRKVKAPTTTNKSKPKKKQTKQNKQTKPDPKTNMKFSDFGKKILLPVVGGAAAVNYGSRVLKNIMDEDKPKTVDTTPKRTGEPISKSPKSTTPKVAAPEITDPSKAKRAERDRTNIDKSKSKSKKPKRTIISDSGGREDQKEKNVTPKLKPLETGKRRIFGLTFDTTDEGMDTDRANFRSGGSILNKRYGMREGGFTKRGGMYKKGY
tara:strand:- start:136 stop:1134 length:999 start_codon:yes stop_codon:yes gene_type:complete